MKQHFERNWGGLRNPTPNKNCVDFVDIQLWANKSLDRRKSHWIVWFHLVEIEAIWATGQLATKICNWDSLFFLKHFEFSFFLVVGYLVMSWHQVLDISISHFFIPASCSEPAKVRTESVRNILRFQHPKMVPQFISKNGREKYVNFGLV